MRTAFIVTFGCDEHVIREGSSAQEIAYEDDLGCSPVSVRLLTEVELRGLPWLKNGELRCEPMSKAPVP